MNVDVQTLTSVFATSNVNSDTNEEVDISENMFL